jgi:hypothetical protein
MARLRRADCSGPGFTRKRAGKGWAYFDESGRKLDDPEVIARINELAIPPAWKDVWICPYPMGHLQAVGTDAAGRKQYRYHDQWRLRRDQEKFDEMLDFARALPNLRQRVAVMFIANQHGDEYVVSEGMVEVIREISGGSQAAQDIREALTVTIVPRVNVDGFDAPVTDLGGDTTPWRQNFDTECPAFCEFYEEGRGYDINRYHSYFESAYDHPYQPGADADNPVPEAIAMRLLWDERQPEFVADFHHQGTYVDEDGRMITGSVMWPNAVEEAARLGISEEFAETVTLSKRVVSEMLDGLEPYGHANITRYPSTTFPGIARNAYGLLGSGSVLFEARGDVGGTSNGYLTKQTQVAAMSVLEAAADGSLWTRSTEPADTIRERGPSVSNPHE